MIRPSRVTILSSSPPRMVPSPAELCQASRYRPSGWALLALAAMVAVYVIVGSLMVPKRRASAAPAARAEATWAPPALKADLERHPCPGCSP